MTSTTITLLLLAAFAAGVIIGAFWRWLREPATEADEYDGIEHPPEPRASQTNVEWLRATFNSTYGHRVDCTYADSGNCNCDKLEPRVMPQIWDGYN